MRGSARGDEFAIMGLGHAAELKAPAVAPSHGCKREQLHGKGNLRPAIERQSPRSAL